MKLGLAGGYYSAGQDVEHECLNLYPEVITAVSPKRQNIRMVGRPGLTQYADTGEATLRAGHNANGTYYVVGSTNLYSVTSGTATSLGAIPAGTVCLAHNAASPQELFVIVGGICDFVDGYFIAAGDISSGYTYDTTNGLVQITDADFPTGDQGQKFWVSNVSDGQNWTATDFSSADGDPDDVTAIKVNHRDILIFGSASYEVWRNQGGSGFPLARQQGTFQERGTTAPQAVADLDNTVYFLGDDRAVYRIDGYLPVRVSDHSVEKYLDTLTDAQIAAATAFTYTQQGHYFYSLCVGTKTLVYDATCSGQLDRPMWHERGTAGGQWRAKYRITDTLAAGSDGAVYTLDMTGETDGTDYIEYVRSIGPITHPDGYRGSLDTLRLELERGMGTAQIWLDMCDDGISWGTKRYRQFEGSYTKPVVFRACGARRAHYLRLTITDAVRPVLHELYGDFSWGSQ